MTRRTLFKALMAVPMVAGFARVFAAPQSRYQRVVLTVDGKEIANHLLEVMPWPRYHRLEVTQPGAANKYYDVIRQDGTTDVEAPDPVVVGVWDRVPAESEIIRFDVD